MTFRNRRSSGERSVHDGGKTPNTTEPKQTNESGSNVASNPTGASRKAKHVEHEVVVRFRDLDALGHVNYSVYLSYLEDALNRLWTDALMATGQTFDPQQPGMVSVRVEIDYRVPALCDQTLVVEVWVSKIGNRSFTSAYRILEKESRTVLVEANTTQVVVLPGEEERRMPNKIRAVLETYSRRS